MTAAPDADGIVVMGRVLAPFGVHGWLKLRPLSAAPDALLGHERWWFQRGPGVAWEARAALESKLHSDSLVARVEGIDSREAAMAWRGALVGVPRADLPAAATGEVYLADLVGLDVVNREGDALGVVAAVDDFGAHPVLRVRAGPAGGGRERLIPFVGAHVDDVDLASRRISVDWGSDY
jgi:16S rRNA processing protein RimM